MSIKGELKAARAEFKLLSLYQRFEHRGVSKKLLTPSLKEAVVRKVNQRRITNSKDLRKLRTILPDPVARAHFLKEEGDIRSSRTWHRSTRTWTI